MFFKTNKIYIKIKPSKHFRTELYCQIPRAKHDSCLIYLDDSMALTHTYVKPAQLKTCPPSVRFNSNTLSQVLYGICCLAEFAVELIERGMCEYVRKICCDCVAKCMHQFICWMFTNLVWVCVCVCIYVDVCIYVMRTWVSGGRSDDVVVYMTKVIKMSVVQN